MPIDAATAIKIDIATRLIAAIAEEGSSDDGSLTLPDPDDVDESNIDEVIDSLEEHGWHDALSDFRSGGESADVPGAPKEWSRHYSVERRACQLGSGCWVSWLYWYGGGKHGEPEAVEWLDETAVFVTMTERQAIVHDFALAQGADS